MLTIDCGIGDDGCEYRVWCWRQREWRTMQISSPPWVESLLTIVWCWGSKLVNTVRVGSGRS
eukprot:1945256-Pyramimonas_sp.AAC.1